MIYKNPTIPIIPNPIGLDAAVAELQQSVAGLEYIEKAFGRAFIHKEKRAGKIVTLPKVYQGEGEYYNPLPNGNFKGSVFFIAEGSEQCEEYNQFEQNVFTRKVGLIFWGNLKEIDPAKDYIFLEEIKMDILEAIKYCKCFKSYDSYVDERYNEVFKEFSSYISNMSTDNAKEEINTQYLMYPYAGFRMSLTLTYNQPC